MAMRTGGPVKRDTVYKMQIHTIGNYRYAILFIT